MSAVDPYSKPLGRFYAFYIERPLVARLVGMLTWGTSFGAMYRSLELLRDLPAGTTVLDACCGAGLCVRWLDPSIARYIGIDSSQSMLNRAQVAVQRRGITGARLQWANVEAIPLPDGSVDVALLYNAVHAVPDPLAAITDIGRCLKPGGKLIGTTILRGRGRRADRFIEREAARRNGLMGPGGTEQDLRRWLADSGFIETELTFEGTLVVFRAVRGSA